MELLDAILRAIGNVFASVGTLPRSTQEIVALLSIVVGSLFCFLGYHIFKYLLGLSGFLLGGLFAMAYFGPNPWGLGELGQYGLAAVVGAIAGAVFYFVFYFFGVFIFGAVAAMWLASLAVPPEIEQYAILVVLGAGFAGGLLALLLRKALIVFFTAAVGAVAVASGIGFFLGWPLSVMELLQPSSLDGTLVGRLLALPNYEGLLIGVLLFLMVVAGAVVQNLIPEPRRDRRK